MLVHLSGITPALTELRKLAAGISVSTVVSEDCPEPLGTRFREAILAQGDERQLRLAVRFGSKIAEALERDGVSGSDLDNYCVRWGLGDPRTVGTAMLEVLAYAFHLDIGVYWAPGEVERLCGDISHDDDGLLIGNDNAVTFRNDGVLYKSKWLIPYAPALEGYGLIASGGFLDYLARLRRQEQGVRVAARIADDIVIDAELAGIWITKEFIRGPKGLSEAMLDDTRFPEEPSGTVTVHQRVNQDSLKSLLFPLLRTEVMWSRNEGLKTIQIEELIPEQDSANEVYVNRYIHAQWDVERRAIVHFDGAVKLYDAEAYEQRIASDMKRSPKTPKYVKLFRVDGDLALSLWQDLVVRFFFRNELVLEYFGGP